MWNTSVCALSHMHMHAGRCHHHGENGLGICYICSVSDSSDIHKDSIAGLLCRGALVVSTTWQQRHTKMNAGQIHTHGGVSIFTIVSNIKVVF